MSRGREISWLILTLAATAVVMRMLLQGPVDRSNTPVVQDIHRCSIGGIQLRMPRTKVLDILRDRHYTYTSQNNRLDFHLEPKEGRVEFNKTVQGYLQFSKQDEVVYLNGDVLEYDGLPIMRCGANEMAIPMTLGRPTRKESRGFARVHDYRADACRLEISVLVPDFIMPPWHIYQVASFSLEQMTAEGEPVRIGRMRD